MGMYTLVSTDAFDELQVNAGVLLTDFDPENPYVTPANNAIVATTQGGVNPSCKPTFEDYGADVDNVPNDMKEFKQITGWTAQMSFTSIKFNAENSRLGLGAADVTTLSNGVKVVKPRRDIAQTDFKDIWWVGDKANGGAYAIRLINALSTEGISIQSTKNGKGTMTTTLTGHVGLQNQNVMPMEIYDIPPQGV